LKHSMFCPWDIFRSCFYNDSLLSPLDSCVLTPEPCWEICITTTLKGQLCGPLPTSHPLPLALLVLLRWLPFHMQKVRIWTECVMGQRPVDTECPHPEGLLEGRRVLWCPSPLGSPLMNRLLTSQDHAHPTDQCELEMDARPGPQTTVCLAMGADFLLGPGGCVSWLELEWRAELARTIRAPLALIHCAFIPHPGESQAQGWGYKAWLLSSVPFCIRFLSSPLRSATKER
jgi:hypothetical protein